MTDDKLYIKYIERHEEWAFKFPDSEFLMPLMKIRFTPDEAEFLSKIPFLPHSVEKLSKHLGLDIDTLTEKLDGFARRGLIYRSETRNGLTYSLTDAIFGFYRMPGWKGGDDEWNRKITPYLNRYYIDAFANEFRNHPTKGLRTIPINKTIKDPRKIMPYEDILKVIDKIKYFTVSTCACRHRHHLDPEYKGNCNHETENCLHFDVLGKYCVQNGLGREITKEETLEILAKAADAGLVHGISTTTKGMDTLCNCSSCCCLFLESIVKVPRGAQKSNYIREIEEDKCIACGLCVERCPIDALELKDKKIIFKPDRCIGCGVCVYKCPKEAIFLKHRDGEIKYPRSWGELGMRVLEERGRNMKEALRKNTIL